MDVLQAVADERDYQRGRWGEVHDAQHSNFEWLGLIAQHAAAGQYIKAAALCIAAEEARRLEMTRGSGPIRP